MMGSAAFLLVYAAVNAGHLRVLQADRGERDHRVAVAAHLPAMFAILGVYTWQQQPAAIVALVTHRRRIVCRGMGLPALDRAQDQRGGLTRRRAFCGRRRSVHRSLHE